MSRGDIVLNTLRRELKKKQARIDKLEKLMTEYHLNSETAKAMDGFAQRFNSAETTDEKFKIADEWKETSDLWSEQVAKSKTQNDNFMKWMDEQSKLHSQVSELSSEIALHEIRNRRA